MNDMTILESITGPDSGRAPVAVQAYREMWKRSAMLNSLPGRVILTVGPLNDGPSTVTVNIESTEERVTTVAQPFSASIGLPIGDDSVDVAMCIGSTVNRCDVAALIGELGRVVRPGGYLFLEFESSRSAELLFQKAFGRSATIAETIHDDPGEARWVYSFTYINNLLRAINFRVRRKTAIHVFSPWARLFSGNEWLSGVIGRLDWISKVVPALTRWGSSQLVVCQKST